MKKFLLFVVLTVVAATSVETATAQTKVTREKRDHVAGFVTNRFWDNWEIQAGYGPNWTLSTGSGFRDGVNQSVYFAGMKWFHPVFGVRFAIEGGWLSYNVNYRNGSMKKQEDSYLYFHPDFFVNVSNWIGGYKKRAYEANVFAGFGVGANSVADEKTNVQFLANAGLQNRFNITKQVSLDVTVQYQVGRREFLFDQDVRMGGAYQGLNATIGATYRFNKRTFDFAKTDAEAEAAMDKVTSYKVTNVPGKAPEKVELPVSGFKTNPFGHDWEIQFGGGPAFSLATKSLGSDYIGWGAYLAGMKWFHPIFGARLTVEAGGHAYTHADKGTKTSPTYMYIHPDLVLGLSNWIGGYKERVWNIDLLVGGGYLKIFGVSDNRGFFAGNAAIQNRFYVEKTHDFSIDLTVQYTVAKRGAYPDTLAPADSASQSLGVFAGITYRFNKRGFRRGLK